MVTVNVVYILQICVGNSYVVYIRISEMLTWHISYNVSLARAKLSKEPLMRGMSGK